MSDLNEVSQFIKNGQKTQARQLLLNILKSDRNNEQAWLYMAACASSKEEFIRSIERVLEINPSNTQALRLADKYDIPVMGLDLPLPAPKKQRKSGGRRITRLLLLFILIMVGVAAVFFLTQKGDEETVISVETPVVGSPLTNPTLIAATLTAAPVTAFDPNLILSLTPPVSDIAMLLTLTPPVTVTLDTNLLLTLTPENTVEATPEATEAAAAPTTTPNAPLPPTPEGETAGIEPEVTEAATAEVAEGFPILADASEYVTSVLVMAGDELEEKIAYLPTDAIKIVVQVGDHGEALTIRTIVQLEGDDTGQERYSAEVDLEPGAAQTAILEVDSRSGWKSGVWLVRTFVNGTSSTGTRFMVEGETAATPTPTRAAATPTRIPATPTRAAPTATPTPETGGQTFSFEDATLSLVYDEDSAYIINLNATDQDINLVRFVQGDLVFEAKEWQTGDFRGAGSTYALPLNRCMQVGLNASAASSKPIDCLSITSWKQAKPNQIFWLAGDSGATTFEIYQGETLITTCEINASSCYFALPE